jgi:hypothetical protein
MERGGRKMREKEIKPKGKKEEKGERSRGREKEEDFIISKEILA